MNVGPRLALAVALLVASGLAWAPEAVGTDRASASQGPETPSSATSLLQRVRDNLAKDDLLDQQYSYRVHRRTYQVSFLGKVTNDVERVYDVAPSPADPAVMYSRPVSVGGRALTTEELRAHDETHRRQVERDLDQQRRESSSERADRLRADSRRERERRAQIDDAIRVYRFEPAGYEMVDGQQLRVVTVEPRPDARTQSNMGKQMKKGRGRAWVYEPDAQLVKIEMQLTDTVMLGLGVIGHVDAGSRMLYRRERLPDGTWVPVEARFVGTGATLLFRPFSIETWARYTDYRRLDPGAATEAGAGRAAGNR